MAFYKSPIDIKGNKGVDIQKGDIVYIGLTSEEFLIEYWQRKQYSIIQVSESEAEKTSDHKFFNLDDYLDQDEEARSAFHVKRGIKNYEKLRADVLMLLSDKKRSEATELIVATFLEKNKIYSVRDDDTKEIWIYEKGVYVPNGKTYIIEFVREILKAAYTTTLSNLVIDKIMSDTFIESYEFFEQYKNTNLLPLQNGLFNLNTGKLEPFNDELIFFTRFNITYDDMKDCPKIKAFLKEIVSCENDYLTMQEIFGWLLFKEYKFEKLVMFLGDGRNGKSKVIELMKKFIGTQNACNLPPTMLENPDSFALSTLYGKIANLSPDIPKDGLKRTSVLKSLSGNDLIEAQRKFKTSITFQNSAKMIFGANELPMTYDSKSAFWERWILIEFPYKFVDEERLNSPESIDPRYLKLRDENIIQKISTESELSGLFNFAYSGYKRLLENGKFSYRYKPDEVKQIWTRKSNSFLAFFMDVLELDYDHKIIKKDLKRAYLDYCKFNNLKPQGDRVIHYTLSDEGVSESRIAKEEGGYYHPAWDGVKFKKDFEVRTDISKDISSYDVGFTKKLVFDFIRKSPADNYHDLCQRFGEQNIKEMLIRGEIYENPKNCIKLMEN